MSKSLGNFFTVREVLKKYRPEVIRFFVLSSQYRSPLNYSDDQLNDAEAALTRLYTALRGVDIQPSSSDSAYTLRFQEAMNDDFNTPVAFSVLFDLARELNSMKVNKESAEQLATTLKELASVLGLLQDDPDNFLKGDETGGLSEDEINQQIQARVDAKSNKDWAKADKIRDQLKEQGVIVEDVAGGTTSWRREKS
jgi:cysteinyl-tRNA synthetase